MSLSKYAVDGRLSILKLSSMERTAMSTVTWSAASDGSGVVTWQICSGLSVGAWSRLLVKGGGSRARRFGRPFWRHCCLGQRFARSLAMLHEHTPNRVDSHRPDV